MGFCQSEKSFLRSVLVYTHWGSPYFRQWNFVGFSDIKKCCKILSRSLKKNTSHKYLPFFVGKYVQFLTKGFETLQKSQLPFWKYYQHLASLPTRSSGTTSGRIWKLTTKLYSASPETYKSNTISGKWFIFDTLTPSATLQWVVIKKYPQKWIQ